MSFKDLLDVAPTKMTKVERLDTWLTQLPDDEKTAAIALLSPPYSAEYAARALTSEGFPCGEKVVYSWRATHGIS